MNLGKIHPLNIHVTDQMNRSVINGDILLSHWAPVGQPILQIVIMQLEDKLYD